MPDARAHLALVFINRLRVFIFIKCANVLITPLMSQCPVSPLSPGDTLTLRLGQSEASSDSANQSEAG